MNRISLTISATVWIMVTVLGIVALLSTGTKLYAVDCWGCGSGDCTVDPPFTCIPNVRNWEMYGTEESQSYCELGAGLYTSCTAIPQGGWCTEWRTCDVNCNSCETDEDSSFPLNICKFGGGG